MSRRPTHQPERGDARSRLLMAAFAVIRAKGYAATTVDDLCQASGVSKGAFFHHFSSKEALAVAAATHWSAVTGDLFAAAPYHQAATPLARVLAYLDFRQALVQGKVCEFTCLVGTIVQEAYDSSEAVRLACRDSIFSHAATLEADLDAAIKAAGRDDAFSARSLALLTQAVLQGAFILAKADQNASHVSDSIQHLKRYLSQSLKEQDVR
ncbi:TetR/AcrR family transcriptional regulator [Ahniella affigens]|uniref:TetR/AcrR family transcriptional regulator n=1 Tax=Ahniella affigens TaxID=2021234 RepID=A0A2P1PSN2_9GAMM|nr:TetR/AcrR family transcriptional regulator [Ahniella affigens]AVP97843.1 TetR/AcrR family transcriptional regulator [Ahniella affigens]